MLIVHTASLAEDETALVHATALALHARARLVSLHACAGPREQLELPSAVPLLERWGLTESALRHERVIHTCCDDTADTLLDAFRNLEPDLVVAATHARSGLARLLTGSVAEAVARNVKAPTLLLPVGGSGFVRGASGRIELKRVLVPAGSAAEAEQALEAAFALAPDAGHGELEIVLLHVDDGRLAPGVTLPRATSGLLGQRCSRVSDDEGRRVGGGSAEFTSAEGGGACRPHQERPRTQRLQTDWRSRGWRLTTHAAKGPLDAAISATARELNVDLVVMTTHGHDGVLDVLLGSVTERVLHALEQPLLWVPSTWRRPMNGR